MLIAAVLAGVLLLAALALCTVGGLGWRGRLPRNRFVGVRTPPSLRSDEAFRAANRAAGAPLVAGGVACLLGGGLAFTASGAALAVFAAGGAIAAVLLVAAGGVLGHHAAQATSGRATGCPGCAGCGCAAQSAAQSPPQSPPQSTAPQLRDSSTG